MDSKEHGIKNMTANTETDTKTRVSKYVSYLLRHNPENLKIDRQGFVDIDDLLDKLKDRFDIDKDFLREIVEKSDRKRFEIKKNRIRALYGHTISVKVELEEDETVVVLYHGTTPEAVSRILREGIKPMRRKWVHLSPTMEIAKEVGLRRTMHPVVLEINACAARKVGLRFYRATDKVYVCKFIQPRFIRVARVKDAS